ncbi:SDR family oxidoreductase [Nocardioides vastitatis]|uniref:SDR family oxidoreductase n=2 Tax=Nocardioides TaxID=1839 RepID=A0ABW0ZF78_9ACTN
MKRVAVVGGTGVVGRHVVDALRGQGHEAVVVARSTGVDVTTGAGLVEALAGCAAVVDAANVTTMGRRTSVAFFEAATRNLVEAGRQAGVAHLVALSIVGCDRVDLGYYAGKRRQEELVLAAGVPGTVLRATQFHEFAGQLLDRTKGPLVVVPDMLNQPIAAREVGAALAELALGEPAGRVPDLAGPEQLRMPDMVRRLLGSRGVEKRVWTLRIPFGAGRVAASGGLVPDGPGPRGVQTYDAWLAEEGR